MKPTATEVLARREESRIWRAMRRAWDAREKKETFSSKGPCKAEYKAYTISVDRNPQQPERHPMKITPDQYSNELTAENRIRHLAIERADAIREAGRHGGEDCWRRATSQANEIRDEACAEYTRRAEYLGSIL